MAWNGSGNFQRTNGSFSGSAVWEDDANAGFDIVDTRHDNHDQDLAQGINNCLTKDGQNSPTADLSMSTFKHTNVGDGTARNHYATIGQLQDQAVQALSSVGGTADAITATTIPAISAYVTGARYTFKAVSSNTGATTLKIGTGSVLAVQWLGAALTGGEIAANAWHTVVYDGSLFQLLNPAMSASARTLPVSVAQLQDGSVIWCGTSGGSANAQTLTPTPAISAYAAGQVFRFIAGFTSTGALTLQVSGLGSPVACLGKDSEVVFSSTLNLIAGKVYQAIYDGTNFLIDNLLDFGQFSNDAGAPRLKLHKSRGTTAGSNVIVQNGDGLGQIDFFGANGTNWTRGAYIIAQVSGTPGASNDMPTDLIFATTPDGSGTSVEGLRITSQGRVGMGTNPGHRFVAVNSESNAIATGSFQSNVSGDLATYALLITKYDNNNSTSQRLVGFLINQGANGSGQINANGASQAAFGSFSDVRLKENITDLPSQLVNIMALRPVEFDYKDGSGHQIGFIAQEVENIYPDLIGDDGNGYLTLSGLGKNEARMIKAFQEFASLVDAKIAALEARVEALEA
jgi:hypothetical protein